MRVPFRSKFPSYIRVACLPKKIIAIKEGITSRQSIRSDSGFTRVKAILEWYIYISQERRRRGRKIKKVKTGEKEPKSRSRRRSTFERQRKKKEEKIYQKTSTNVGRDAVVVVARACPEYNSRPSTALPLHTMNFVPKREALNANFIHGI